MQEYLNLTVAEARHRPSAGHLEANALAGLGQPSLYDIDSLSSNNACTCTPDDDTTSQNIDKNEDLLCTPQTLTQARSSSNLDSEGYLKLRMSSELLDHSDRIPSSPALGTCHVTKEDEGIPTPSIFEDILNTTEHSQETEL